MPKLTLFSKRQWAYGHSGIAHHPDPLGPVSAHDVADRDIAIRRSVDYDPGLSLTTRIAGRSLDDGINIGVDSRSGFERHVAVGGRDADDLRKAAGRDNDHPAVLVRVGGVDGRPRSVLPRAPLIVPKIRSVALSVSSAAPTSPSPS